MQYGKLLINKTCMSQVFKIFLLPITIKTLCLSYPKYIPAVFKLTFY